MSEVKTILELAEKGNYMSLHLDNFDKKYPGNNNKDTKMPNIKYITPIIDHFISKCTTST